ncbi:hypothetical protein PLESTM_000272700 [Pleodorina starrii]|nr:hypothetical protein PLESTM_000272700 [Pleodorina starrii]
MKHTTPHRPTPGSSAWSICRYRVHCPLLSPLLFDRGPGTGPSPAKYPGPSPVKYPHPAPPSPAMIGMTMRHPSALPSALPSPANPPLTHPGAALAAVEAYRCAAPHGE